LLSIPTGVILVVTAVIVAEGKNDHDNAE
jgi:hypothetical protein